MKAPGLLQVQSQKTCGVLSSTFPWSELSAGPDVRGGGCFPLFLHVLTSLITLALWLKFFHRQMAGCGHREEGTRTPFHFKNSFNLSGTYFING